MGKKFRTFTLIILLVLMLFPLSAKSNYSLRLILELGPYATSYFDFSRGLKTSSGGLFTFYYSPLDHIYFGGGLGVGSLFDKGNFEVNYFSSAFYSIKINTLINAIVGVKLGASSFTRSKQNSSEIEYANTKLIMGLNSGFILKLTSEERAEDKVLPLLRLNLEVGVEGTKLYTNSYIGFGIGLL